MALPTLLICAALGAAAAIAPDSTKPLLFAKSRHTELRRIHSAEFRTFVGAVSRAVATLEQQDKLAAYDRHGGVWVRSSPKQAELFKKHTSKLAHAPASKPSVGTNASTAATYGFYLHTYKEPTANINLLRTLRLHYPDNPVYIMSDGGMHFDGICKEIGNCEAQWRPPANDRWNPVPFFNRFKEAALWLKTKYVVMLEPDNEIHGRIAFGPSDDAGGLKDSNPAFKKGMKVYMEEQGRKASGNPDYKLHWDRFGLAGGSYFRTAAILDAFNAEDMDWKTLRMLDNKRIYSSDVAMPAALAVHGYTYQPWEELTQTRFEKAWGKPQYEGKEYQPAFQHHGRDEGKKPHYEEHMAKADVNLVKEPSRQEDIGQINCQGCVWIPDSECWNTKPLVCPHVEHDFYKPSPDEDPNRPKHRKRKLNGER